MSMDTEGTALKALHLIERLVEPPPQLDRFQTLFPCDIVQWITESPLPGRGDDVTQLGDGAPGVGETAGVAGLGHRLGQGVGAGGVEEVVEFDRPAVQGCGFGDEVVELLPELAGQQIVVLGRGIEDRVERVGGFGVLGGEELVVDLVGGGRRGGVGGLFVAGVLQNLLPGRIRLAGVGVGVGVGELEASGVGLG
ncbi:hypothetical protein, partial [Streptomyces sp. NPDC056632]|uniref:hypothetical protein n=1 Tax=Streptomyces sp. NPDC056632 TaxID=3345884 RepID=UPI00367AD4B2